MTDRLLTTSEVRTNPSERIYVSLTNARKTWAHIYTVIILMSRVHKSKYVPY